MSHRKPVSLAVLLLMILVSVTACERAAKEVEVTRVEVVRETTVERAVETVIVRETIVETVLEKQTVVEKQTVIEYVTPTPEAEPEKERTLVICQASVPDNLYDSGPAATQNVLQAVYDGPIDNRSFGYQPVILEKLPSLADGDAVVETVTVQAGELVVDHSGEPATLEEGVTIHPAGCASSDCAVEFTGNPIEMDQMVVTFKLKEGIVWSDGEPLTAHDSVYFFELVKDPDTQLPKFVADRTASYEATDDHTTVWTGLPGFRDATYFVNFWSPRPEHRWGDFTALELQEAEVSMRKPIGWGPYVIEESVPGERISMRKNELYWRADEGLPRFDKVIFRSTGESADANIAALLTGECDIVITALANQSKLLLELQAVGQVQATFVLGTVWEHADFGVNPVDSYDRPNFFGDVRTRRAIAHCMDRQAVVKTVLFGQSVVLDTFVPPGHPLYNADIPHYEFDVEKGSALLEEVGWRDDDGDPETPRVAGGVEGVPDGTPLEFHYWTTTAPARQQATQILQASLAKCGIKANLEYMQPSDFFAGGPDGPMFGRQFDVGQFAWLTGVEPPCHLYGSWEINGPEEDGFCGWSCLNVTGWSNDEYDTACRDALQSLPGTDEYERSHLEAQRIFAEELPVVPLYMGTKVHAARPDVQGFIVDPTENSPLWNIEAFDY